MEDERGCIVTNYADKCLSFSFRAVEYWWQAYQSYRKQRRTKKEIEDLKIIIILKQTC